jgi:hypothetical protein
MLERPTEGQTTDPEHRANINRLIAILPEGSVLRTRLEEGQRGSGRMEPYMKSLSGAGVRRVSASFRCQWDQRSTKNCAVLNRQYFRAYDDARSQIVNDEELDRLRKIRIEAAVDLAILNKAKKAKLFLGVHGGKVTNGTMVAGTIELVDNPFLSVFDPPVVGPYKANSPTLESAAMDSDAFSVTELLAKHKYSRNELTLALARAIGTAFDNSVVIDALVRTGADVNHRFTDGETMLTQAVGKPVHVRALLRNGAKTEAVEDRPLRLALIRGDRVSARLLREAGAKTRQDR